MTKMYPYVVLDERFEGYACGQTYGEWTVDCDDWNDDLGGSGLASIRTNVKSGKRVIYVFAKPLGKVYIEIKTRMRYRTHYLGCCFDLNIKLVFQGASLLAKVRFDVCENKVKLQLINPTTGELIGEIPAPLDLGQLQYGTKDSTLYYYYVLPYMYSKEDGSVYAGICEEKSGTCYFQELYAGTYQNLASIELSTETDATTADVDIHVDDVHIESDTPVNVYVQQTVPEYIMNIFTVMMYVMIVIIVTSLMFQLLTRLIDMFVGVSRW